MNLSQLLHKADKSRWYRRLLNWQLGRIVPFNRSLRFRVRASPPGRLTVELPHRRANCNHLGGLHACALATLAELTTGLLLIASLNPKRYRLILSRLDIEYHYQAQSAAQASFTLSEAWLEEAVKKPLQETDKVLVPCEINLYDRAKNHLATATAHWQIKDWQAVKTGRA